MALFPVGGLAEDVFIGRETEQARLKEVLTRASQGQPWLVTIEGESGVGKTALARRCVTSSPDLTVLWARADPAESDLDYGVVDQLVRGLPGRTGTGDSLLALGGGKQSSAFAVGAELLGAMGDQLRAGPVAVAIDDVQWADRRSVEALSFMFRRFTVDPIAVILVVRGAREHLDEPIRRLLLSVADRQRIVLSGLGKDDVALMAEALGAVPLDAGSTERLHVRTGGHPLYLHTVLSDPEALERTRSDPTALPSSLAAAIGDQLATLPAPTRSLLEMLAVVNAPMPLALLGEAAGVAKPSDAVEAAIRAGLVDRASDDLSSHVAIRHQLQRDAIYAGVDPARRRELHARAAGLVDEPNAWAHRVAALDRPDEDLAAALEQLGAEAALHGHFVLAATRLQWAADVSPERAGRERRMLNSIFHLTVAEEGRALALRPAVEAATPSALRECILATLDYVAGDLTEGELRFREALSLALSEPDSQVLAPLIANRLAAAYSVLGEGQRAEELGRWALGQRHLGAAGAAWARSVIALGLSQTSGPRRGLSELAYLDPDPARIDPVDINGLCWRGICRMVLGDLPAAIGDLTAGLKMVRDGATISLGLRVYAYLGLTQYVAGEWDAATITAEQGLSAVAVRPRRHELPLLHLAAGCVAAGRGLVDEAEAHARAAEEVASSLHYGNERVYAAMARAMTCQAAGDYAGMSAALGPWQNDAAVDDRSRMYSVLWRPLLVEGLIGSDQYGAAGEALDRLRDEGAGVGYLRPALAWLEGWLAEQGGDPEEALAVYERGGDIADTDSPVYAARLLLAHGRLLRRLGRHRAALERLRKAHELYLGLGATPFVGQVEAELLACGLRQPQSTQHSVLEMTFREREVAHLIERGLTNAEIGAELFITPKAVEYHLGNLYAKLGVKGRQGLRRFLVQSRRPAPA